MGRDTLIITTQEEVRDILFILMEQTAYDSIFEDEKTIEHYITETLKYFPEYEKTS